MTLDKIDLIDRKFSKSLLGYRPDEVDRLVAEVADSIGRLAEEKMALTRVVEELRREVEGYRSREATLRDTLLTTQAIVDDVKAKARREAEGVLDQARDQAEAMLLQAREQALRLSADIDTLAQRKTALATRFREMLMAALDILDAQEAEDAATAGEGASTPTEDATPVAPEVAPSGEASPEAGTAEDAADFSFADKGGSRL